jgi:multiple sugar transport system permease protein
MSRRKNVVEGKRGLSSLFHSRRVRSWVANILWYAVMLVLAFLAVMPFLWMISTSLKGPEEVFTYPPRWVPKAWCFQNYVDAFKAEPFARYFYNSGLVAICVTVGQLISCSLAAFAFARMEFWGKGFMFGLVLSTTMISTQVTLVPSYLIIQKLDWIDTYQGLIIPFIANAFGIFMLRQAFKTIPDELEDAAKLDGCGRLRFLWKVCIPLVKPTLAAQALFAFMGNWNAYLWPLIVTNRQEMRTLQIGLRYFVSQEGGTEWGVYMAATMMVITPLIVLYFTIQKSFIEGIATTGLKG